MNEPPENPPLQKCHYCGALTHCPAMECDDPKVIWPPCCINCIGKWEVLPVADAPSEMLEQAKKHPYVKPASES